MQLDNDGAESSQPSGEEGESFEWLNAYRAKEEVFIPSVRRYVTTYWIMVEGADPPIFACSGFGYLNAEYRLRNKLALAGRDASAPIRTREIYRRGEW